jgi:DNA mismatch repair ATPase MutS
MKTRLLYRSKDFDFDAPLPPGSDAVCRDLGVDVLFETMSQGDQDRASIIKKVVLTSCGDVDAVVYRQEILKDCLAHGAVVKQIYDLAVRGIRIEERDFIGSLARSPSAILHRATFLLEEFTHILNELHALAEAHDASVRSEGLKALFAMLRSELNDEYLLEIREHLQRLKFPRGVLISARLGAGNTGADFILCEPPTQKRGWLRRVLASKSTSFSFRIPGRDENGARALDDIRSRGLSLVAAALGQSTDHVLSFFRLLRDELTFYLGCLNLHGRLADRGQPTRFPEPVRSEVRQLFATDLYDVCLALGVPERVVPNDLYADGKDLIIITGANQGGKSTFLRAVGLAQIMMQCGMFVPARTFHASLCAPIFSHFKREEDETMASGKLDEELGRMSQIAEHLRSNSLVLLNESFAATNEREGSEIAEQIITALIERGVKVMFVTHQYEFARKLCARALPNVLFLKAERRDDGQRTLKMIEGEPSHTSFGADLYRDVFADPPEPERISHG